MFVYTIERYNIRYLVHDLLFSKEEINMLCEAAENSEFTNTNYDSDEVCSFLIENYGFRYINIKFKGDVNYVYL